MKVTHGWTFCVRIVFTRMVLRPQRKRHHVRSAVDTPKDQAEDGAMLLLPSIPVPISADIQQQGRLTVESSSMSAESGACIR